MAAFVVLSPPRIAAGLAAIIPLAGGVLSIAALIYALYTFYLGAPVLGRASTDKAAGYTIVVALCGIVAAIVLGSILAPVFFGASILSMGRSWI